MRRPVLDVDKMRMKVSELAVVKFLTCCSFAQDAFSDIPPVNVKKQTRSKMVWAFFFFPQVCQGCE